MPRDLKVAAAALGTWPWRRSGGEISPQTRWAKLPEMVRNGGDRLTLYQIAYALFLPEFQRELLAPDFAEALTDGLPSEMRRRISDETRARTPPRPSVSWSSGSSWVSGCCATTTSQAWPRRWSSVYHSWITSSSKSVDRLADEARYQPLGRKAILRRIGLRGIDPALFDRPKSGFVLPFDRWIRCGLKGTMDQTLRDPKAIAPTGLNPRAVERLWRAFLDGAPGMYWSRVWSIYVFIRWCHSKRVFR